jgi:hypothetical protein
MEATLSSPRSIAVPGSSSAVTMLMLSLSSSWDDPQKLTQPRTTTAMLARRDRTALLASRRNEAEARLRERFLRFGTAVRCLGGGSDNGATSSSSPSSATHTAAAVAPTGAENVENPSKAAPGGADSRLDALRKRRSRLAESLSFTVGEGGASSGTTTPSAAPASNDETDSRAPVPALTSASADRNQRIEVLRSRRRELEARTHALLLRGERYGSGVPEENTGGSRTAARCETATTTSTGSSSSSSSATLEGQQQQEEEEEEEEDLALPKRRRWEPASGPGMGALGRERDSYHRDLAAGPPVVGNVTSAVVA